MKNSTKLILITSSLLSIIVFLILLTFILSAVQSDDAIVINLAGRQRMLSQKVTKEFLFLELSSRLSDRNDFKQSEIYQKDEQQILSTMAIFQKTLFALKDSGEAPLTLDLNGPHRKIRGATKDIEKQMQKVVDLWLPFEKAINRSLAEGVTDESIEYVKRQNLQILKEMNTGVDWMQQEAEKKVFLLKMVFVIAFLLAFPVFIISILIIRLIIKRINWFSDLMKDIAKGKGTLSVRMNLRGSDEFASLAKNFNIFVAHSEKMQMELIEISRQAGVAMIATSTLHNIGNVLNSINVSANVIAENLKTIKVEDLKLIAELLGKNLHDIEHFLMEDDQGKNLLPYANELGTELVDSKKLMINECESLRSHLEHAKQIMRWQQSSASVKSDIWEDASPKDIFEEAYQVNASSFGECGIPIEKKYHDVAQIKTIKHKVVQILINLIANAKQSILSSGHLLMEGKEALVTLSLSNVEDPSNENSSCSERMIRFSVKDSGAGIKEEDRQNIFQFGFTTKEDGHGFGLHSCALAAKELGGSITFESEGEGQGATFIFIVPEKQKKN